jgi:hypothetical protein
MFRQQICSQQKGRQKGRAEEARKEARMDGWQMRV